MESSRRVIARNTVYLYIRMFVMLMAGLYTSRIVLDVLGVNDYGIYSLLSGFVTVFAFLNTTMTTATMRFLNFAVGKDDAGLLRRTFGTCLWIHLAIAVVVLLLAESVGVWYVDNYLEIAPARMVAAHVVYRMSVLAVVAGVIEIPFTSAIMSHERMGIYTSVNVIVCLLKIGIALVLVLSPTTDNLVFYSTAIFAVSVIGLAIYAFICKIKFAECKGGIKFSRDIFKSMLRFSGLDIFGNMAWTVRLQGTAVVLNRVGGTAINAAAGVAMILANALQNFGSAVLTAFRPQILQSYSRGDVESEQNLMIDSARTSGILLTLVIVPAISQMPFLMHLWLGNVPDYAVDFARILMIATYGEVLKSIVDSAIHATGRVGRLSFITGGMFLAELIGIYFIAKHSYLPYVFLFHTVVLFVIIFVETLILRYQMSAFRLFRFWWRGIVQPIMILGVAFIVDRFVFSLNGYGWTGLFFSVCIAGLISGLGAVLFVKKGRVGN